MGGSGTGGGGIGELDFSSVQVPTYSKYGVGSSFNKKQHFIWLDSLLWPSTRTATAGKPNLKFWAGTWTKLRSNFPPYCQDVPSRTTRSCLLLRKEEIRPNIWPEIPSDLNLWRRTAWQRLSKFLDISSVYSSSTPRPVKNPSNFIRYNYQNICSWSRRPRTILKIRKNVTAL